MAWLDILDPASARKKKKYSDLATQEIMGIQEFDYTPEQLQVIELVNQGKLKPEDAQVYLSGPSAMEGVKADPRLEQAQMGALKYLQDIATQGGLTAQDKQQLAAIEAEQKGVEKSQREAVLMNAAQRGVGGSGLSLSSQMQAQQNAANQASQRGVDVASMAQQRALQAMMQSGQMAGQVRGQQFGEQSQVAQARDAINRFNTQNQQQVGMANVGARNQAQQFNLSNAQQIANQNAQNQMRGQEFNIGQAGQNAQNRYTSQRDIAALRSGAFQAQSDQAAKDLASNQSLVGGLFSLGGTLGAAALSDKNLKENVQPFDAQKFMDEITGYKYTYKDPKHGSGPQVGVMAQDVEKVAPQMVDDTSEGKMIDYNKAGGPLFASLSNLNERLKKIEGGA